MSERKKDPRYSHLVSKGTPIELQRPHIEYRGDGATELELPAHLQELVEGDSRQEQLEAKREYNRAVDIRTRFNIPFFANCELVRKEVAHGADLRRTADDAFDGASVPVLRRGWQVDLTYQVSLIAGSITEDGAVPDGECGVVDPASGLWLELDYAETKSPKHAKPAESAQGLFVSSQKVEDEPTLLVRMMALQPGAYPLRLNLWGSWDPSSLQITSSDEDESGARDYSDPVLLTSWYLPWRVVEGGELGVVPAPSSLILGKDETGPSTVLEHLWDFAWTKGVAFGFAANTAGEITPLLASAAPGTLAGIASLVGIGYDAYQMLRAWAAAMADDFVVATAWGRCLGLVDLLFLAVWPLQGEDRDTWMTRAAEAIAGWREGAEYARSVGARPPNEAAASNQTKLENIDTWLEHEHDGYAWAIAHLAKVYFDDRPKEKASEQPSAVTAKQAPSPQALVSALWDEIRREAKLDEKFKEHCPVYAPESLRTWVTQAQESDPARLPTPHGKPTPGKGILMSRALVYLED